MGSRWAHLLGLLAPWGEERQEEAEQGPQQNGAASRKPVLTPPQRAPLKKCSWKTSEAAQMGRCAVKGPADNPQKGAWFATEAGEGLCCSLL